MRKTSRKTTLHQIISFVRVIYSKRQRNSNDIKNISCHDKPSHVESETAPITSTHLFRQATTQPLTKTPRAD